MAFGVPEAEKFLASFEPEAELSLLRHLAASRAKAKAELEDLKKAEKSILAAAALASDGSSAAARETDAYASEAYAQWRAGWKEAVLEYEKRSLAFDNQEKRIEVWRTLMASQRTEAQLQH